MIVRFIVEILGKPVSVVDDTLKKIVETVASRYKVKRKEFSKAEKVQDSDLLSAFTEFDFEAKNFEELFNAVLDFGPTVVEIIEPKEITVKSADLQNALSDLVSKFHAMSQALQQLQIQNIQMQRNETTKK